MRRLLASKYLAGRSLRALGALILFAPIGCGPESAPQPGPSNDATPTADSKDPKKAVDKTSKIQRPPE